MVAGALSFLDRQLLGAVAPTLKREFHLSNAQYGGLVSAFFLLYSISAPLAGAFVDAVGLNVGAATAVVIWSVACGSVGLVQSLPGLMACRMALGLGEAGSIPAGAKAGALYLEPEELGLRGALGAAEIAIGGTAAPLLVAALAPQFGWRAVFLLCGVMGLFWVPLWLYTARQVPPQAKWSRSATAFGRTLLANRRLWSVAAAFGLGLAYYSLWANWTTVYLVEEHHLTELDANRQFAWAPPVFGMLGALSSGILTFYWIRRGMAPLTARLRACWHFVPLLLVGMAVPFLPTPVLAVATIGVSLLGFQSILNNIFILPIDLFGARPAGFTTSLLIASGAAAQAVMSPLIGVLVDRIGFTVVCLAAPLLPLLGIWLVQTSLGGDANGPTDPEATGH